jgi:hypothetical protein
MPYFVYAIHTDNSDNRLYGEFDNYAEAGKKETEMMSGNYPGDNYFVRLVFANDLQEADIKADALRPHPKLP